MRVPLIYREKPIFGFDLGTRTAKLVQLKPNRKGYEVLGYGYANFPAEAIVEGIIVDPEEIASALKPLLKQMSYGKITATRVAVSLPVSKVFTRTLQLPHMEDSDLAEAIQLEAEQYIPVPVTDLYIDHEIIETTKEHIEVLLVASPRAIVDSFMKLFEIMNLEVAFIESSLGSVIRSTSADLPKNKTTLVADFGSVSIDLTVFDQVIRLTDTIAVGGDDLSESLVKALGVPMDKANEIKYKFGLDTSDIQPQIMAALDRQLQIIVSEMKRVIKYYAEKGGEKHGVESIVLSGGSAGLAGFPEYLAKQLNLPVVVSNPWKELKLHRIQEISKRDYAIYTTAIGLAKLEGKI